MKRVILATLTVCLITMFGTVCAEPITEFVDLFILGDGEESIVKIIELIRKQRAAGAGKKDRRSSGG